MAENEKPEIPSGRGQENKNVIIILVALVILLALFAIVIYFMVDNVVTQRISKITPVAEEVEDEAAEEGDEIQRGIIVDLGDFILNLCDEAQKKYLKVNVAIEVSQKDTDFAGAAEESKGGHGHEAPAPKDPMESIQQEMNQFKPAIRDVVITNLSSKTSAELSTAAGKELAKEQISNEINSILAGEREVLRVSFGQFIIQ
ncbi:MAG: flagellar basal body-associated FliL family protein [bacterium]|nr:flagellar basal body-associated FliL family protein [bacterium]